MYLTYIYVSRDADRNPSAVQAFPFSVTLGPEGKGVWEIIEFMWCESIHLFQFQLDFL